MKKSILLHLLLIFGYGIYAQNAHWCNNSDSIKIYFIGNGFNAIPIKIIGSDTTKTDPDNIRDYAKLKILFDGAEMNFANTMANEINQSTQMGIKSICIITKNENFCEPTTLEIIKNDYNKGDYDASINVHLWKDPGGKADLMFLRYNLANLEELMKKRH